MSHRLSYSINKAQSIDILNHLCICNTLFIPPLSERVDIEIYVSKLINFSVRFEAWNGAILTGLLAIYTNDRSNKIAYITNISVIPSFHKNGIASKLLTESIVYTKSIGFNSIRLEVNSLNKPAIFLYQKFGFKIEGNNHNNTYLILPL